MLYSNSENAFVLRQLFLTADLILKIKEENPRNQKQRVKNDSTLVPKSPSQDSSLRQASKKGAGYF